MPVNTSASLERFNDVAAERFRLAEAKPRRMSKRRHGGVRKRVNALGTQAVRAAQDRRLIDEIGGEERRRHGWPTFDHEAGDAASGKRAQRAVKIDAAVTDLAAQ